MNANRRRMLWIAAIAATLVTAASVAVALVRTERMQPTTESSLMPALPVETIQVRTDDSYVLHRAFTGHVQPRRDSVLGFELGGRLAVVEVEEGAIVSKGERLAALDTVRLEAQRAELTAALTEQAARLALSKATLARMEGVVKAGGISHQELDEAREGHRTARAALELAQRRIASMDVELDKAQLRAPFAGTIVARMADEGRVLGVGDPVLQLQASATPEIRIGIAGRSVDGLRAGETYVLEWQEIKIPARLRAVLPLRTAAARTVDALFDPIDADARLRPGDLVRLRLAIPIAESGSWLPVTALTEGERGLWSVYVAETAAGHEPPVGLAATHRVVRHTVDLIHQEAGRVYVRGAITAEDQVVTTGQHRIVPGQWVRPAPILVAQGGPSHD